MYIEPITTWAARTLPTPASCLLCDGACAPGRSRTVAGSFHPKPKAGSSMATSRFKTNIPSVQSDTRPGFGRGSAVREYWLERCQGFSAVRSDGRQLGRVKRVENRMDGTFLRLAGVRARTIPVASVETVWPGASLLLISDVEVDESCRLSMRSDTHHTRPAWEDETLPWWELVPEAPNSSRYSNLLMVGAALSTTIGSARSVFERATSAFATQLGRQTERSRNLIRTVAQTARRFTLAALDAVHSARTQASKRATKTTRRLRRRLALTLFAIAVWIAGGSETFLDPGNDGRRRAVDEEDTAEI